MGNGPTRGISKHCGHDVYIREDLYLKMLKNNAAELMMPTHVRSLDHLRCVVAWMHFSTST